MIQQLRQFTSDEGGAVTVEYVLLTAAIVSLSVVTVLPIATGTQSLGVSVSEEVARHETGSVEEDEATGVSDEDAGDTESGCPGGGNKGKGKTGVGNQGNDKDVGNAGGC